MRIYTAAAQQASVLGVDPYEGLSEQAIQASREAHGDNHLPELPSRSLFEIFVGALSDRTLLILIGAAFLALGVEGLRSFMEPGHVANFVDGVAILVAVTLASGVTTLNDWRADMQFKLLGEIRDDVGVAVRRSGHVSEVSIHDLVVGDIVLIEAGDKVPADGLLLSGVEVSVDQSAMTGESMPVEKGVQDLELRAGGTLLTGAGAMLVMAVGAQSELGKLHSGLHAANQEPTPLQQRLARLADRIGLVGLSAAVLTFLALASSDFVWSATPPGFDLATASRWLTFAIVAVTIVVVAVPEGLPLAVTISLAYSVRKMAEDKNLVRTLASCETMGAATVICSDKTGTLTENRMAVVAGWVGGAASEGSEGPISTEFSDEAALRVRQICAINSTAYVEKTETGRPRTVGNPTEGALLTWMADVWADDWHKRREQADISARRGFSSDRKQMSTVVYEDEAYILLVKGAPEILIAHSNYLSTKDGDIPWLEEERGSALATLEQFARRGHRTLALAYKKLPKEADAEQEAANPGADLVFLALLAIADPIRSEVRGALHSCRAAGVEVKLVTGDNQATATAVAEEVGLFKPGELVLEGPEFRAMDDSELKEVLPKLRVLARSVPLDKLRLVEALKNSGEVVAVTGDGTNDGPALRSADVGFSMGIAGTELAKEASDIVLLDDNFASIVSAIRWGRGIFENVRRFLQFQLTVNVVALSTAFLAAVLGFGLPLNTVQLLWVNLIMDTLAALALATEAPAEELLNRKPHGRHEPLVTSAMIVNVMVMSMFMLVILLTILLWDGWVPDGTTQAQRMTFVFNTFVMMQLFNEINARSTRFDQGVFTGLHRNPLFIGVLASTTLIQIFIVQYGGDFFRTTPLSLHLWGYSVLVGLSMLPIGWALRSLGKQWFPASSLLAGDHISKG